MDAVRQYILTLTVAAMLCALVKTITAGHKHQEKIIGIVCGIFLLAMALRPVGTLEIPDLASETAHLQAEAAQQVEVAQREARQEMASIISEETAAYILDKADAMGLALEVGVELDENLIPYQVRLEGPISPYARDRLSQQIESELGIPVERQVWTHE